jgi:hypothetical protein
VVTNQTAAADTKQDGRQAHATGGSGARPCAMRNMIRRGGRALRSQRPRLHTASACPGRVGAFRAPCLQIYSSWLCSRRFSTETEAKIFLFTSSRSRGQGVQIYQRSIEIQHKTQRQEYRTEDTRS